MYQKNFVHDKLASLGPKIAHPLNHGSALRVFFKFCRIKRANRYMKILLIVFREKDSFGAIWSFWPLGHVLLFDWAWSNWVRPLLTGSLNSQDMIRILKEWRHDFLGKHLCGGYCTGIMWVYVWRPKFMVLWSFFKNFLRKFVWM